MTSQLDDFLGSRSALTRRQIERLVLQISLQKGGNEGLEGESGSTLSGVSPGAYYRVLSQARSNIDQALYTVLLCSRMGSSRWRTCADCSTWCPRLPPRSARRSLSSSRL